MSKINKYIFLGLLVFSINVNADEFVSIGDFADQMVVKHGFEKSQIINWISQAKKKQNIIRLMTPPRRTPGKKRRRRPWYKYQGKFITRNHIDNGVRYWRRNRHILKRAEKKYGVPAEIIIAIIGVETRYGRNKGGFRIIDALKTLSFDYLRRADFFRQELEHFFLLAREEGSNPLRLKGSYAGAFGIGQFMPSSYRRYAVDFNGDGRRDIWNNHADAIGSVANYFNKYGWEEGKPVMKATQVRSSNAAETLSELKFEPRYTLAQLKRMGARYNGNESDDTKVMFVDLRTRMGTAYWIGFKNYYVITRYNHSKHYAMAVYQLSQEIARIYEERYN
jgi:membrane-bound lytic murein transglycosylase B